MLLIGMVIAAPFLGWRIIVEHQNVNQATGQHHDRSEGSACTPDQNLFPGVTSGTWDYDAQTQEWVCLG